MDIYFLVEELTPLVLGALGILTVGRIAMAKHLRRQAPDPPTETLTGEVRALRDRVQVLERALVEPSNRLSREIEDLRD